MRRIGRAVLTSALVGAMVTGAAWAGAGLRPVPTPELGEVTGESSASVGKATNDPEGNTTPAHGSPDAGQVLAGASKVSIRPRPADYNGTWEKDHAKCSTLSENFVTQLPGSGAHLASAGSPWPENPNCLYMGGFGIGPMNPITSWDDDLGLWVRTFAVGDGADTLVLTVIDAEGYFWEYGNKCESCGSKAIAQEIAADLGLDPSGIVIAATHSHASPDLIGGWGFVPDWYMTQIEDSIKQSITEAVQGMEPATLEAGEQLARPFNSDRRDTYRSAEEQQVTWLRATSVPGGGGGGRETIATLGAFAAHPTTKGTNGGQASADWVGVFERTLEDRFGGIGLHFMSGLGNMSASGGTAMGAKLAALIPESGGGIALENTDVRFAQREWQQPVTNAPLTALGLPGFFDHRFQETPASIQTGKSPDTAPCQSSSPVSVTIPATAARIGDLFALTAGPGELFSNLTNTLKEKSGAAVTMPLAQANDALGYMPQSFEINPVGQQGLGFVAGGVLIVNYEDSYAIDRCIGDMDLETTIELLNQIK